MYIIILVVTELTQLYYKKILSNRRKSFTINLYLDSATFELSLLSTDEVYLRMSHTYNIDCTISFLFVEATCSHEFGILYKPGNRFSTKRHSN